MSKPPYFSGNIKRWAPKSAKTCFKTGSMILCSRSSASTCCLMGIITPSTKPLVASRRNSLSSVMNSLMERCFGIASFDIFSPQEIWNLEFFNNFWRNGAIGHSAWGGLNFNPTTTNDGRTTTGQTTGTGETTTNG